LTMWLKEQVKRKRMTVHQISTDGKLRTRLGNLKHVHTGFLSECHKLHIGASEYPFNQPSVLPFAPYKRPCVPRACSATAARHIWQGPVI
jgi:hypothetical protein